MSEEPTQEELVEMTREIRWMIANEQWVALRRRLDLVAIDEDAHPTTIVCALRAAYTARRNFPGWESVVLDAATNLSGRGLDAGLLLRGL